MAQDDYSVANGSGATVRADINSNLAAIVGLNSGAAAPSTTFAYMLWADTTNGVLKRRNAANSGWLILGPLASTMVQAKTANYTVVAGDYGTLIDATSGTFTLSLTAAATLGDGHVFAVRNSGSGLITIDPNSSETIDGATTIPVYPGEAFLVFCNGTSFKTVGRQTLAPKAAAQGSISGGTLTTNKSFNCSVARNSGGNFTVTFDNALPDANYLVLGTADGGVTNVLCVVVTTRSTSAFTFVTTNTNGSAAGDPNAFSIAVFSF